MNDTKQSRKLSRSCLVQIADGHSASVKVSSERIGRRIVVNACTDRRPFNAAKVDIVHQQEILATIRIAAINACCQICKLCTRKDQVRICLGTATAAKAAGNSAIPKVSLGCFKVFAASVASTDIGSVTESSKLLFIEIVTLCAGITNVTLCCAGGFCAFGYYVVMLATVFAVDNHPLIATVGLAVLSVIAAGSDVTPYHINAEQVVVVTGLPTFGSVEQGGVIVCDVLRHSLAVLVNESAVADSAAKEVSIKSLNVYEKNFACIECFLITHITLACNGSICSQLTAYNTHTVFILVPGGGDSFLVVITAIGAGVTNVTACCASCIYSFGYAVGMLARIGNIANGTKSLKSGKAVVVLVIQRPYVFKIPSQVGSQPVLGHKILKRNRAYRINKRTVGSDFTLVTLGYGRSAGAAIQIGVYRRSISGRNSNLTCNKTVGELYTSATYATCNAGSKSRLRVCCCLNFSNKIGVIDSKIAFIRTTYETARIRLIRAGTNRCG